MHRRPFRACLSLLLMLTLVSMLPAHAAMAMPTDSQGAAYQMQVSHEHVHGAAAVSLEQAASPTGMPGQHDGQCHCGAHCGMCGICYSAVSTQPLAGLNAARVIPATPRLMHLVEIVLPVDPRPPRA